MFGRGPLRVHPSFPTQAPPGPWWQRLSWWLRREDGNTPMLYTIFGTLLLLIMAAIFRQPVLAIIGVGALLATFMLRLFWDRAFGGLTYERRFSVRRARIGDEVEMELVVTNAKPIPVARLDIRETADSRVQIRGRELRKRIVSHEATFDTLFSLGMYERSVQRYTLECTTRGWHRLGPADVSATESFGLTIREGKLPEQDGFLVWPRMVPVLTPIIPARLPLGDAKPSAPLMEDPSRVAGVRPYQSGDSLRQINWRATARTAELQTRVNEQSADPVTMIFLDTENSAVWDAPVDDELELRIVVAASIARQLIDRRQAVGMASNAPVLNKRRRIVIPASRKTGQLPRLLDGMAEINEGVGEPIEQLLTELNPKLPWGASLVLVTSNFSADVQRTLQRIARQGAQRDCVVICIGAKPTLSVTSRRLFDVFHLGNEVSWREIPAVGLARLA